MRALFARAAVVLVGISLSAAHALAQQRTITGTVTSEQGGALPGVSVVIQGTRLGTVTNGDGSYSLRAETGQVLQFRLLGYAPDQRPVGNEDVINVQLRRVATQLNEV